MKEVNIGNLVIISDKDHLSSDHYDIYILIN